MRYKSWEVLRTQYRVDILFLATARLGVTFVASGGGFEGDVEFWQLAKRWAHVPHVSVSIERHQLSNIDGSTDGQTSVGWISVV